MYNLVTESFENGFKTTFDDLWNNPEYASQKANVIQLAYDMIMFTTVGPILVGMM